MPFSTCPFYMPFLHALSTYWFAPHGIYFAQMRNLVNERPDSSLGRQPPIKVWNVAAWKERADTASQAFRDAMRIYGSALLGRSGSRLMGIIRPIYNILLGNGTEEFFLLLIMRAYMMNLMVDRHGRLLGHRAPSLSNAPIPIE